MMFDRFELSSEIRSWQDELSATQENLTHVVIQEVTRDFKSPIS